MGREIFLKTSQDEPFNAYLAGDESATSAVMILHKPGRRIASFGCSFGGKESMQASLLEPNKIQCHNPCLLSHGGRCGAPQTTFRASLGHLCPTGA
ncbi:MAG: hypothetical protein PVI97_17950 [Candidatus Thiodiazotropha sp.]|jgi:hypothetical protein